MPLLPCKWNSVKSLFTFPMHWTFPHNFHLTCTCTLPLSCRFTNVSVSDSIWVVCKVTLNHHTRRIDILRKTHLCFNCLQSSPFKLQCTSEQSCQECWMSHHTLLHLQFDCDTAAKANDSTTYSVVGIGHTHHWLKWTSSLLTIVLLQTLIRLHSLNHLTCVGKWKKTSPLTSASLSLPMLFGIREDYYTSLHVFSEVMFVYRELATTLCPWKWYVWSRDLGFRHCFWIGLKPFPSWWSSYCYRSTLATNMPLYQESGSHGWDQLVNSHQMLVP